MCSDHVQIEIGLSLERYQSTVRTPKIQPPFPVAKWPKAEKQQKETERDNHWERDWGKVACKFKKAQQRKDVEAMHQIWTVAAVETIKVVADTKGERNIAKLSREQT